MPPSGCIPPSRIRRRSILLIGQVARDQTEREAFQEIDFRRMFGPVTKWVAQIDDARRIPELVSQAFHRATSGRPGPVVLALPEDMLTDVVEVPDAGPYHPHPGRGRPSEHGAAARAARRGQAAAGDPGRRRLVGARPAPISPPSPRPTTCRSPIPSAARICSTISIPIMSAMSASASIRSWPSACARPMCCWWWARGWAR